MYLNLEYIKRLVRQWLDTPEYLDKVSRREPVATLRYAALQALESKIQTEQQLLVAPPIANPSLHPDMARLSAGTTIFDADGRESSLPTAQNIVKTGASFSPFGESFWTFEMNGQPYKVSRKDLLRPVYEKSAMPLFPHEPRVSDVRQGTLGDCYLLAALAGIVRSNPGYIKQILRDNGDGTVSVRLYQSVPGLFGATFLPRYMKLEKSEVKVAGENLYAWNSLWVQMIEKAYAASGLNPSDDPNASGYAAIQGGYFEHALQILLGRNTPITFLDDINRSLDSNPLTPFSRESQDLYQQGQYTQLPAAHILGSDEELRDWMAVAPRVQARIAQSLQGNYSEEIRLEDMKEIFQTEGLKPEVAQAMLDWFETFQLLPGKRGTAQYTQHQLMLFNQIGTLLSEGNTVILSTYLSIARPPSDSRSGEIVSQAKGLLGAHSYTVLATGVDPFGLRWCKLYNSWGRYVRDYQRDPVSGRLKAIAKQNIAGEEDGVFWLELSDLTKRFSRFATTQ